MRKIFLTIITFLLTAPIINAISINEIRFNDKQNDTLKINQILIATTKANLKTPQERIMFIAKQFIGTPYVAHTLESQPETLTINMSQLDCTTFVETVMALAYTVGEGRQSWRDFAYNLERIRYRDGKINGYASRLHYISDWILNNAHRGNFYEATNRIPNSDYQIKTIDFMSTHRKSYTALSDTTEYERIKNTEIGYHSHRFPYIKKSKLNKKSTKDALKDGDIIALTCNTKGLDVSHLGIIIKINGIPHLLHASSKAQKVIEDPLPLYEQLNRGRNLTGIRVIRLHN